MEPTLQDALLALSSRQFGLIARHQAVDLGMSSRAWRHHRANNREWESITPRVLQRRGSPLTERQRALAAVLDVGPSAYLSHRTGAAVWEIPGYRMEPFELIVVRDGKETETSLAVAHRPRHLPDPFATFLDGLPVVRPAVVLLELAPIVSPEKLRRLLDNMWNRRLLSGPSVRRDLKPLMHRGRAGTVAIRQLLDSLPKDYVPPASGLEGRFAKILADAGIVGFDRQVDLGDGDRWCGRVDFRDSALPLLVEIDSERYHSALTDIADDEMRQRRLEAGGFTVVRITDQQVWFRPSEVVAEIRRARASLRRVAA